MSQLRFFEHAAVEKPKYLVIFLHGYGANGENLLELHREFEKVLPDGHFISPNAPQHWEGGFPDSYQWFSLSSGFERKALQDMVLDIKNSNKILSDFIAAQLKRFSLQTKDLFLVGFSQGAMMSMYQGLIMPEKPAGVIAFSGRLILPQMLGDQIISRPEICLIHGQADSVVPFESFIEAEKLLKEHGLPFESHAIPDLDHSINFAGVHAGQRFLKKLIS